MTRIPAEVEASDETIGLRASSKRGVGSILGSIRTFFFRV
jgi:hypothetical protein